MSNPHRTARTGRPSAPVDPSGFFGIGIVSANKAGNLGALSRSAHAFGASIVFTIAYEVPRIDLWSDTTKAIRHLAFVEYATIEDFLRHRPPDCELVGVEFEVGKPHSLPQFQHPPRALYLLGSEDRGLGPEAIEACRHVVQIPSRYPLNVATAGSIVLYDRVAKSEQLTRA